MTRLRAFLNLTVYVVVTDYGREIFRDADGKKQARDLGIGCGDAVSNSFDDAVSEWADRMADGLPSAVIEVHIPDGIARNATSAAAARAAQWEAARHPADPLPKWLAA